MKIKNLDEILQKIDKIGQLSNAKEISLIKTIQYKGADCDEMEQLCLANMGWMINLSCQYKNRGLSLEELIEIASEELEKYILKYDYVKYPEDFRQYAIPIIRHCLDRAVENQYITIGIQSFEERDKIRKTRE